MLDNDSAPTFVGGNIHYCDAAGDGSGAAKYLHGMQSQKV